MGYIIDKANRWLDKGKGIPRVPMLSYTKCRAVQSQHNYDMCDDCIYRFECFTKSDKMERMESKEFTIPR